jgi:hypothetical protein
MSALILDASVALLAGPGDRTLTSDPGDLRALCEAAGPAPWWSAADGEDGAPARVRTRGAGNGRG